MFILRSDLLNSWLIAIKMLIWACVEARGICVTDILFMGREAQFSFHQRSGFGTQDAMAESGSIAAHSLPVRCDQECISLSAWFFLPSRGYRTPIYLQTKGQVFTRRNLFASLSPTSYSQKWTQVLHFCTAQIAVWIHACSLELFPAVNSGCRSAFPRGQRCALRWEAWFSGLLVVPKYHPAISAAEILCV